MVDKPLFDTVWGSSSHIHQDPEELWWLIDKLSGRYISRILEIGAAHGGTLLFWQAMASTVVSVDKKTLEGGIDTSRFPSVEFIVGDSHDAATRLAVEDYLPFDFLFIDGDHSYEGCLQDWKDYRKVVKPGGIVAFHDVSYGTVREPDSEIGCGKVFESIEGFQKERIDIVHGIGIVYV